VTAHEPWSFVLVRRTVSGRWLEQRQGREEQEGARAVVVQRVEAQVLLSASEKLDQGSCSAPTPLQCPFSRATTHYHPSQQAAPGHPSPKITRRVVPRKHIWHGTWGYLALQARKVEDDRDLVEEEVHVR